MVNKKYIGIEVLDVLTIPPPPPSPTPPPPTPTPFSAGRWVDISRDGSTLAIGESTAGFTGGAMHMLRGVDFETEVTLTSTLGSVNEYGNGIATNADGSIVVCGCLKTGMSIDGFAAVRYGVDWASEIQLEPVGSSTFLAYGGGGNPVAISDDGSIIVLKDSSSIYVCSGVDWGDIIHLIPSDDVWSVAISGDGTVIAAGNGYDKVHVYSGASYATHTIVAPSGIAGPESFGWNMSLNSDGTILAVGNPSNGTSQRGAGYLFTGAAWATEQKFFVPSGPYHSPSEQYGWAVDISADGSVAAFTAWGREPTGVIFRYNGSGYSVETQELRPDGGGVGSFGLGVALNEDGSIMAVSEASVWVFNY